MHLITSKTAESVPKIRKGAFILFSRSDRDAEKKLSGSKLYIYITDEGFIGGSAVISKEPPPVIAGVNRFAASSEFSFNIDNHPAIDHEDRQNLAAETLKLRGSRINPTYMEVSKVVALKDSYYVEGAIYSSVDPRLEHMDAEEETAFGAGTFDPSLVKGHHSGMYVNLAISPFAEDIEKIVVLQQATFEQLFKTRKAGSDTSNLERKIEASRRLLKPHAYQVYKHDQDHIYFINTKGDYQAVPVRGLRDLDRYDRIRVRRLIGNQDTLPSDTGYVRSKLYRQHPLDRFESGRMAFALEREALRHADRDDKEHAEQVEANKSRTPLDGPLGAADLPGLRHGLEFLPHQPYILGSLKDTLRQMVDCDPGGGKTLIIICDILQQMKAGRIRRPIVVMPDYLLASFASEVKMFSELNPWIVSTESVEKWERNAETTEEALSKFLADAHDAPPNTVFLTSFNWLGRSKTEIPCGVAKIVINKETGEEEERQITSAVYDRPNRLMAEVGIDSIYVDECHVLSNDTDQVCATVTMAKVPVVRALTGTIMPGNLVDVTGPMGFVHSGVLGSMDDFLADFSKNGTPNLYHDDAPKKIRERLAEYGVPQVRKTAWQHLLPKSQETTHYVSFTDGQQRAYDMLLETAVKEIERDPVLQKQLARLERQLQQSGGEGDTLELTGPLLSKFTPLEVFINSPAEAQKWLKPVLTEKDSFSPKADLISEICRKHLANRDSGKVLVFCQFRESARGVFNALDPDLKEMAAYYEGGMIDVLQRLKNPGDPLKIVIGVDRTLRTGHNIQSVNCIIHADLVWLNGDMQQREARAIRPGQTRQVDVHYILTEGSAEMLKMARLISADHMVSKANSDFDDKHVLQPVSMTLAAMKEFRSQEQLHPYIDRKSEIKRQSLVQADHEKTKFGSKLLKPNNQATIADTFGEEAKILRKVPSARTFVGDSKNVEYLIEEELKSLPAEPHNPKLLEFHLKKINEDWAIVCYYTTDPQGWVRRMQFRMSRTMWFVEVGSKSGAMAMIEKIKEKGLDIANENDLIDIINGTRVTDPGARNTILRTEKASRARTRRKVAAAAEVRGEIALNFGLFDGTPVLWVDTVDEGDSEVKPLRSLGFRPEPAFWYLFTSRTLLNRFLTRLQQLYPDVRLTNWDVFKSKVNTAFRGLDLSGFDGLAQK